MSHRSVFRKLAALPLAAALLMSTALAPAPQAEAALPPLELNAKSAILLDYETGQVLFEQNADVPLAPASLTKLMTLHLAYKRIEEGAMKADEKVEIRPEAWAAKWEGSSLMFLEPGQNVTVAEIMKGIAIPSGNDASVALAQHMAGTVDGFVSLMNDEAKALGFDKMQFADPAGLSPQNTVTAKQFAQFSRLYVAQHENALAELHSVVDFAYPQKHNVPEGQPVNTIKQPNRNGLLAKFPGTDGLKTGFIDESGYNIALTAKQGDMRLVAVILGVPGRDTAEGSTNREAAGASLLQWGFQNWETAKPQLPTVEPVRVWKGAANEVTLEPARPVALSVEKGQGSKLQASVEQESSVVAPVTKGTKLGQLVYKVEDKEVARIDLVAAADVEEGGFFKRIWDAIRLWVMGLFSKKD